MYFRFRTLDHPEAQGRKPEENERFHHIFFPVEQGQLKVELGDAGMVRLTALCLKNLRDKPILMQQAMALRDKIIAEKKSEPGKPSP